MTDYNYIYLLQEREFVNSNQPVYKIGKSTQANTSRIRQYPKGSILHCLYFVDNCHNLEIKLLHIFRNLFDLKSEYGNEYFHGDKLKMVDLIHKVCVGIYEDNICVELSDLESELSDLESDLSELESDLSDSELSELGVLSELSELSELSDLDELDEFDELDELDELDEFDELI